MKISRFLTAVFLLIFFVLVASAADVVPVRWRSFVKMNDDGTGNLVFRALVSPGWHLYGLDIPEDGPKATSFDFEGTVGVKFTGDITPARKPLVSDDPLFGMSLSWWDSNIDFVRPFTLEGETATVKCKITYMACDGSSCRPPKSENITIPVKKK